MLRASSSLVEQNSHIELKGCALTIQSNSLKCATTMTGQSKSSRKLLVSCNRLNIWCTYPQFANHFPDYQAIAEAIDDDANDLISVYEINNFLKMNRWLTTPAWFALYVVYDWSSCCILIRFLVGLPAHGISITRRWIWASAITSSINPMIDTLWVFRTQFPNWSIPAVYSESAPAIFPWPNVFMTTWKLLTVLTIWTRAQPVFSGKPLKRCPGIKKISSRKTWTSWDTKWKRRVSPSSQDKFRFVSNRWGH